ncbi:methyltransferase domain-containing protein [Spirosoma sp. HMF4905]|uniref:Methyltransferase domain-containing protein n=1 Tax=Spirosoma arboris TaxID=2682092 RepID=A0A7K1SB72_9BACT|nr:class I SAM-dependent methyltransferase [Spirosoma arboris]MVM30918.1 methyltransferase domain-containing protein [Spirosoma arboris]
MVKYAIENKAAQSAFTKQSAVFDQTYASNSIVSYKREKIRSHVEKYVKTGSTILELNAGTGQDAVYFAQKGYSVHATDISEGMLSQLQKKVDRLELADLISHEQISFLDLEKLTNKGPFEAIFSNFGGLNCTQSLDKVISTFAPLLKPNGYVTLVIMPPFCLWEFLHVVRGHFKVAFRRLFAKKGAKAHIDGVHFLCWYYPPSYVIKQLKKEFDLVSLEGVCTIVPPSYMEGFPDKYPGLWQFLKRAEAKFSTKFPFNRIGDYYAITLQKKSV